MKFGLKEDIIKQINEVFTNYPQIDKAILYGSRAKGNHKNRSDIDLSLEGEKLNLSLIASLLNDLDELLLPYTFDISILRQISNRDLVDHIERDGKLFYEKNKSK